jgi:hypothetical protein
MNLNQNPELVKLCKISDQYINNQNLIINPLLIQKCIDIISSKNLIDL